jgi:hypothetical protein
MTSTMEPPESDDGAVLKVFADVADRYVSQFELDERAHAVIDQMLVRGTAEVLRLPAEERDDAIGAAIERLENAMLDAADELHSLGAQQVSVDALTTVMQGLCPVPPFCLGMGDPGTTTTSGSTSGEGAYATSDSSLDVSAQASEPVWA